MIIRERDPTTIRKSINALVIRNATFLQTNTGFGLALAMHSKSTLESSSGTKFEMYARVRGDKLTLKLSRVSAFLRWPSALLAVHSYVMPDDT